MENKKLKKGLKKEIKERKKENRAYELLEESLKTINILESELECFKEADRRKRFGI